MYVCTYVPRSHRTSKKNSMVLNSLKLIAKISAFFIVELKLLCRTDLHEFCNDELGSLSVIYAKQKHPGCKKSARPIRSSIANRYVRPKTLISVEAKKFTYQKSVI